jgi:hypothetical protein
MQCGSLHSTTIRECIVVIKLSFQVTLDHFGVSKSSSWPPISPDSIYFWELYSLLAPTSIPAVS